MNRKIDISHKTVFFIAIFIVLLWLLYQIRDVIIILFIAIILMSALSPIVDFLTKKKIPKTLAISVVYIFMISIIVGLISAVITPLVDQTVNLSETLPSTIEHILPPSINSSLVTDQLGKVTGNALTFTLAIFNNFITLISVAVLTFYMLLEKEKLDNLISQLFVGKEERAKAITQRIMSKLGAWFRGQIVLSFIIGIVSYAVLFILDLPFALPLAILAGILEVVPVMGPIISAIPAILIAYTINPVLALMIAGSYFVIQQLESHLIVPQVMKKAVGLNPLIVILAVAIGGRLLGIAGALLAVPITVVLQILIEELLVHKTTKA